MCESARNKWNTYRPVAGLAAVPSELPRRIERTGRREDRSESQSQASKRDKGVSSLYCETQATLISPSRPLPSSTDHGNLLVSLVVTQHTRFNPQLITHLGYQDKDRGRGFEADSQR
jgi:hypothetical protein